MTTGEQTTQPGTWCISSQDVVVGPVKSAPFQNSSVPLADEGVVEDQAGERARRRRARASGISITSGLSWGCVVAMVVPCS